MPDTVDAKLENERRSWRAEPDFGPIKHGNHPINFAFPTSHPFQGIDKQTQWKGLRRLFNPKQNDSPEPLNSDNLSSSSTGSLALDTAMTNKRHEKACELLLACLPKAQQDTCKFLDFADLESKAIFDDESMQSLSGNAAPLKTMISGWNVAKMWNVLLLLWFPSQGTFSALQI